MAPLQPLLPAGRRPCRLRVDPAGGAALWPLREAPDSCRQTGWAGDCCRRAVRAAACCQPVVAGQPGPRAKLTGPGDNICHWIYDYLPFIRC